MPSSANYDNAFSLLETVVDYSPFVYRAMGFLCEFHELSTDQLKLTLVLARYLKQQGAGTVGVLTMGKLPHLPRPRRSEVPDGKPFRRNGRTRWTCSTRVSAVPDTSPAPGHNSKTQPAITLTIAERVVALNTKQGRRLPFLTSAGASFRAQNS